MTLTILLSNRYFCNTCPCLHVDVHSTGHVSEAICGVRARDVGFLHARLELDESENVVRPDWCKEVHGL